MISWVLNKSPDFQTLFEFYTIFKLFYLTMFNIIWILYNYACFGCVVINHQKGEIVANMASYAISSSFILVIRENMIIGTNYIV
jgi:hypothetical protein